MKYFLILTSLLATLMLTACQGTSSDNGELYIYNWGDFIDHDILDQFTEETGIRVTIDEYPSNEDMYNRIKSGGVFYDIAFPSDYMIERMINEDMLEKINFDNIPNIQYIDDLFKNLEFDPNNEYSVPYMWGTVGILYNTTMVSEPVNSWQILWNEDYAGQIFMYDSMRDSIGVALMKLGYSINSRNEDELLEAKEALIQQAPLVQAYLGDEIRDKMIGEEGALSVVYSGDAVLSMELNSDLNYAVPKEGTIYWFDGMVIPKGARNKENAEKFIDFINRPEIAAQNSRYIGYATANSAALQFLDPELVASEVFWPPEEVLYKSSIFADLGEYTQLYYDIWTAVLIGR